MKKILSVVLALAMVLAMGVTAFAADPEYVDTLVFGGDVDEAVLVLKKGVDTITASQDGVVVIEDEKNWNVTAAGTIVKITAVDVKKEAVTLLTVKYDDKTTGKYLVVVEPEETVVTKDGLMNAETAKAFTVDSSNDLVVEMDNYVGITAGAYNVLKALNADEIIFKGNGYKWTLYRGDYTKMNVTRDIVFDVNILADDLTAYSEIANDTDLDADEKKEAAEDLWNTALKALGNDKADPYFFEMLGTATYNEELDADDKVVDLFAVASKPVLTLVIADNAAEWAEFNSKFKVDVYAFADKGATRVVKGANIAPSTREMTVALDTVAGGLYGIVDAAAAAAPVAPSTGKDNVGTGANNATAAVVALIVLAGAAVASKKIAK